MAARKECMCVINATGIIKDAKVLEVRAKTVNDLIQRYGLTQEQSQLMGIRDNSQYLRTGLNSFERTCDISKLGDRLNQYQLGKDKLEQFRKEPKNLHLAVEAGEKIYGAVFSKLIRGLVECKEGTK